MRRLTITFSLLLCLLCVPVAQGYTSSPARPGDPLSGHPWYVDHSFGVWWDVIRQYGAAAAPLRTLAENPMSKTFGAFEPRPEINLRRYLARAQSEAPGAIPFISLSRIEHQSCPYVNPGSTFSEHAVDDWVRRFSDGIGGYRVTVLVEADKLAVMGCLPRNIQARRYRELNYEIHTMHTHNPNAIVYLDAGASDWVSSGHMTRELKRADVAEAQGFALGASHFDWTSHEVAYGQQISQALGGKHFVVNTDSNGHGPKPRFHSPYYHGGCTPPGEGIGVLPTVLTRDPHIDGFLWLGTPGFESGACLGQNVGYGFNLTEAISLVRNAVLVL
ncbi:MAG TPA: glycoside hydrolase family 6 protein [Solirubrobacteraceae bacterium]|nr:glycoside hydrolase family 6 protein [Solirubrobacteraceae bacterium]